MSAPASRRGFLHGLASLPLIGGGVTLIGNPVRAAEAPSEACLHSYLAFLHFERSAVYDHLWPGARARGRMCIMVDNPGGEFHRFGSAEAYHLTCEEAAARAPVVLATIGLDWREDGR